MKAAKLVGKKYDIPDLRDIMTTGLGFSQDCLNELQAESSVDEVVSEMDSMKILKNVPTLRCEIDKAIFADYNGMTSFELLQLHKQNKHTDNVIGATYFKRRIEPGVSTNRFFQNWSILALFEHYSSTAIQSTVRCQPQIIPVMSNAVGRMVNTISFNT